MQQEKIMEDIYQIDAIQDQSFSKQFVVRFMIIRYHLRMFQQLPHQMSVK
jgi:hypothetical protein